MGHLASRPRLPPQLLWLTSFAVSRAGGKGESRMCLCPLGTSPESFLYRYFLLLDQSLVPWPPSRARVAEFLQATSCPTQCYWVLASSVWKMALSYTEMETIRREWRETLSVLNRFCSSSLSSVWRCYVGCWVGTCSSEGCWVGNSNLEVTSIFTYLKFFLRIFF